MTKINSQEHNTLSIFLYLYWSKYYRYLEHFNSVFFSITLKQAIDSCIMHDTVAIQRDRYKGDGKASDSLFLLLHRREATNTIALQNI